MPARPPALVPPLDSPSEAAPSPRYPRGGTHPFPPQELEAAGPFGGLAAARDPGPPFGAWPWQLGAGPVGKVSSLNTKSVGRARGARCPTPDHNPPPTLRAATASGNRIGADFGRHSRAPSAPVGLPGELGEGADLLVTDLVTVRSRIWARMPVRLKRSQSSCQSSNLLDSYGWRDSLSLMIALNLYEAVRDSESVYGGSIPPPPANLPCPFIFVLNG
jgi:hypothetical protein